MTSDLAVPTTEELEALVGWRFPGGTYTVEPWRVWLTNDVVGADQRTDGVAHPMFCYYAAMAGMGLSIAELFTLCSASADDGPMFGESDITQHRSLEIGTTYTVRGEITSAVRKQGARTGTFDIVAFRLEVVAPDGEVSAVVSNSFIYPRRTP
ncbi:hypothetical protein [Candidatus Poriferisocius sp.]|uniref:hypothetical protein n=1 Tax=Candidatus Poriferisocius sp. TaxID=3101276 RepID=UPI003B59BE77